MMSLPSDHLSVCSTTGNQCKWHVIQICEAVLLPAFVWREVASPTVFKKKQKEILKTTKYRVNLSDQQRKKEQDDKQWEKQIDC